MSSQPLVTVTGSGRVSWSIARDKILLWFVLGICPIVLPFMGVYKGPSLTIIKWLGAALMIVIGLATTAWFINEVKTWLTKYTITVWQDRITHTEQSPWKPSQTEFSMKTITACEPFAPLGEDPDYAGYVRLTHGEQEVRLNIGSFAAAEQIARAVKQLLSRDQRDP